MAKMDLTPLSVVVDEVWGEKGTPERDAMEARLKEDLQAYYIGEAIKAERLKQHLTQEELGAKIGVKKSQISKLESGKCIITLPTMSKVFKALGFGSASLDLGIGGKVTLW
ncbi:helix-turn-helix domain protein [Prevotella sp. CAG:755]|mgnify:FL=1|nr:helix-turn-helix domain protein [Prevotella sp. CAG:755]